MVGFRMARARRLSGFVFTFLLCLSHSAFAQNAASQRPQQRSADIAKQNTAAVEITPEGVQALVASGEPFLLIDADADNRQTPPQAPVRAIYYTRTPSFRAALALAPRDRNARADAGSSSQRLTGVPTEWDRLGLRFVQSPLPTAPLRITSRTLSEAMEDGVDLQTLDLRGPASANAAESLRSAFPDARRLLPHEVEAELPKLSKLRRIVLIDDGNRAAEPIAQHIFMQGYPLVATAATQLGSVPPTDKQFR